MMNDTTSDMLTRIRNAQKATLLEAEVIYSTFNLNILKVLKQLKFIKDYRVDSEGPFKKLYVFLRYVTLNVGSTKGIGQPIGRIRSIKRISKPGRKVYCDKNFLNRAPEEISHIVSTSRGVIDGVEARKLGIGGELICSVS